METYETNSHLPSLLQACVRRKTGGEDYPRLSRVPPIQGMSYDVCVSAAQRHIHLHSLLRELERLVHAVGDAGRVVALEQLARATPPVLSAACCGGCRWRTSGAGAAHAR